MARRAAGGAALRLCGKRLFALLARSWRGEVVGEENLQALSGGSLLCLWHGRMVVGVNRFRETGYHVLVSPSDDGTLSRGLLDSFGYRVIRGSTRHGATAALREMLAVLNAGGRVVVTPDGPRGPRHSVNPGPAWMARATGFPIVPVGMACDRAWHLSSWDRFTIPKPGARIVYVFGEPVRVAREGGDGELERATRLLGARMEEAERRGFDRLGVEPDW